MKVHSITRRLSAFVLLAELLLAGCTTGADLLYQRRQALRSFDVMLHGRADSVFGAVQDAEDNADDIKLDALALHLPASDLYEVREDTGKVLGRSPGWQGAAASGIGPSSATWSIKLDHHRYRGITLHGIRGIDLDEPGGGSHHGVQVYYAASTHPITHALWEAARFLLLTNSILLLGTGLIIVLVLRRGMAPLKLLAAEAAQVSASSWAFQAPVDAYAVEELAPLASALDAALKRLELSFRQQKDFVSDAAHELKTAVTIVKSSLQLLSYRPRSPEHYQAGLEGCLADCARMEELVQKMLALARAEQISSTLSLPTTRTSTELAGCLADAVAQMNTLAALRQVRTELHIEASDASLHVAMPSDDLTTLSTNLVLNAIQHSHPGGHVKIRVQQNADGSASVEIRDQGEGIPSDDLPFVFDRFRRGDPSRSRETGGTGLGLAICKAIVEAYRGYITIESTVGAGTTVIFGVPTIHSASSDSRKMIKSSA